jgi:type III secretion protein Q
MSPADACLAALAAALDARGWPPRLERVGRDGVAREATRLAARPGRERLVALAEALGALEPWEGRADPAGPSAESPRLARALARARRSPPCAGGPGRLLRRVARQLSSRAGDRTLVRGPSTEAALAPMRFAARGLARPVESEPGVLLLDMPRVGRGQAEVDAAVRAIGVRAARLAADALSETLGVEVRVEGQLLPGRASLGAASTVPLDLPRLPGSALLAVECGLAVALADRLAGGPGDRRLASSLSPAEGVVLDLLALAAIDATSSLPEVAAALSPRLGGDEAEPHDPVAVDLRVVAGGICGRALLVLPPEAVRALRRSPELPEALADARVAGSLRSGGTRVDRAELDQVEPGDVVLLDEPPGERAAFAWPGGGRAVGRLAPGGLEVEEVDVARMTPAASGAPILLEVDLGPAAVTLGDLARLEPGGVLPLGIDRSGRVRLRLGERVLGVGTLVDVDGEVGVRLSSLGDAP